MKTNNLHYTSCKHNTFKTKSYGILCKYIKRNQINVPVFIGRVKQNTMQLSVGLQSPGVTESEDLPKATEIIIQT